jgi:hypothetical protein
MIVEFFKAFFRTYVSEMDYWYGDVGRFFVQIFRSIRHPRVLLGKMSEKISSHTNRFKGFTVVDWANFSAKILAFMTPVMVFSSIATTYAVLTTLAAFALATITWWLFYQNASFTWSSRTRNANNAGFHRIAAWFSNGLAYVVVGFTAFHRGEWAMLVWYMLVTTEGSVFAVRFSQRLEKTKKLASGSLATKGDLELEINRLLGRIVLVYSRSLRKIRSLRDWVNATFATKQELQELKEYLEDKIAPTQKPQPVYRRTEEFEERKRTLDLLAPKSSRKYGNRIGQLRLGL